MRQAITTVFELVGMFLIAVGVGLYSVPAGLIVGGCLFVLIGYLAAAEPSKNRNRT